jgi:hypothetical protein
VEQFRPRISGLIRRPKPQLQVSYTNTYPKAPAVFAVKQSQGLSNAQVQTLTKQMREAALLAAGQEMVMDIVVFVGSWLMQNNNLTSALRQKGKQRVLSSLAAEMRERAEEEEMVSFTLVKDLFK